MALDLTKFEIAGEITPEIEKTLKKMEKLSKKIQAEFDALEKEYDEIETRRDALRDKIREVQNRAYSLDELFNELPENSKYDRSTYIQTYHVFSTNWVPSDLSC